MDMADPKTGNPPLTELGHAQAQATAARLANEAIAALVASSLQRARQTAAPLAAALNLPLATEHRIGEIDRDGGRYQRIEAIRDEGREAWHAFLADPVGYFGGDGKIFLSDTLDGWHAIIETMLANPAERRATVAFSHGFPINILLNHALGLDGKFRFAPAYGSITRLIVLGWDRLSVLSLNETAHFPSV